MLRIDVPEEAEREVHLFDPIPADVFDSRINLREGGTACRREFESEEETFQRFGIDVQSSEQRKRP